MITSLRTVVARAVTEIGMPVDVKEWAADLATELQTQLGNAGFAIHALDGRCVRPRGPVLGRTMTAAEAMALASLCGESSPSGDTYCALGRNHNAPHAYVELSA